MKVETGWMDVAIAPKDGTWLDVWVVHHNGAPPGRWTCVSWKDGAWRHPSASSVGDDPGHEVAGDVTHWMHQPAPPGNHHVGYPSMLCETCDGKGYVPAFLLPAHTRHDPQIQE